MKKAFLLVTSMLAGAALMQGQTLVSNVGGNITVQNGAILTIEGTLENTTGGTIDNQGTIILEGDLMNDATFTSANPSVLRFQGADTSKVTSGGAVFNNVEIAKDATHVVQLLDPMTVGGTMTFDADDNQVVIGDHNLVLQDAASFAGYDDNDFVVTNGLGYVRMEDVDNAEDALVYPVGYNSSTYNPVTITPQAGHSEVDDIDVRVLENAYEDGLTGNQITEGVVNATWEINEGTPGGSDVNLELQWHTSDEAMLPVDNGISRYDDIAMNWDLEFDDISTATDEGGGYWSQSRANVTEFSPFAVGGEAVAHQLGLSLKVFLHGAYESGSGMMTDILRDSMFIPTTEPYSSAPYNYPHVAFGGDEMVTSVADFDNPVDGDDIVDWVVVSLRAAADSSTVIASKSALLQRDGDIVDLDGESPLKIPGLSDGSYVVGINHRNHLGIRSSVSLPLDVTQTPYDFTTGLGQAYNDPGITNDQMVELVSNIFGMWGGDANVNGEVTYQNAGNDKNEILSIVGALTPNAIVPGYSRGDVNMNGIVTYQNANNDKNFVLSVVGALTPNSIVIAHQ